MVGLNGKIEERREDEEGGRGGGSFPTMKKFSVVENGRNAGLDTMGTRTFSRV